MIFGHARHPHAPVFAMARSGTWFYADGSSRYPSRAVQGATVDGPQARPRRGCSVATSRSLLLV